MTLKDLDNQSLEISPSYH